MNGIRPPGGAHVCRFFSTSVPEKNCAAAAFQEVWQVGLLTTMNMDEQCHKANWVRIEITLWSSVYIC